jgi:transcription antitermination protein NusB
VGIKRRARELALQMMFQLDLGTVELESLETGFLPGTSAPEAAKTQAMEMVRSTWARLPEIDARIRELAEHWDLSRMAAVDRNVLRLAAWEILFDPRVPKSVAINEAIEIVKRFSTPESGKFVNGVLDRLQKTAAEPPGPQEA